ncbi:hypothetical protein TNCV_657021 [Trichonephila clavipes]|nr:hypothetical protein TNCV_657021 [Trichonephila clavipes]
MGALIEPLPCRFDCDYEYETAVSSGTQGDESILAQVDENMFTLDDHPLDPNAFVKTAEALAEAANARKLAMEKDYQQIAQFREEEHRATMTYKKKNTF